MQGQTWKAFDYGEHLALDAQMAEALGEQDGIHETRKCVLLAVAAALLLEPGGEPPPRERVKDVATGVREHFVAEAWAGSQATRGPAPLVSPMEQ